jgi:hypothetical protein
MIEDIIGKMINVIGYGSTIIAIVMCIVSSYLESRSPRR